MTATVQGSNGAADHSRSPAAANGHRSDAEEATATAAQVPSGTTPSGSLPLSPSADQVQRYALKTLELLTQWIHNAETDPSVPSCKWENSGHLRQAQEQHHNSTATKATHGNGTVLPALNQLDLSDEPVSEPELFAFMERTLDDSVNPWTHRFLDKLYTTPTTLSPALELMLGALNASGVVSSASPALSLAEEKAVESLARLIGWDVSTVDGLTMPGGSASNVLAVQTALGNVFPSFKTRGLFGIAEGLMETGRSVKGSRPVILTSEQSHYSIEKAALACGMGIGSVHKVRCDAQGRMELEHLDELLAQLEGDEQDSTLAGFPFFVNVTSGTTILGAFDDILGVAKVIRKWEERRRQRHPVSFDSASSKIWIHVDGSWGGPVIFSAALKKLMNGIEEADSLTINPHKILNITQQCSFALFKRAADLTVNVTGAKYLFHGGDGSASSSSSTVVDPRDFLRRNPGAKTMGCGRRPDAYKFYVEWLRVGTRGFASHVERGVSHADQLVNLIQQGFKDTLEVAESTLEAQRSGRLFLQVCFRPRAPSLIEGLLKQLGLDVYPILSHSTHSVHAQLRAIGRFTVDKAPLSHPSPNVGYFIRLVVHPNTPVQLLMELVADVDRLGRQHFDRFQTFLDDLRRGHDGVHGKDGDHRVKMFLRAISDE